MIIAALSLGSWSEIAALITIILAVCGLAGTVLVMWLGTKFVKRTAYYMDKREIEEVTASLKVKTAAMETAQALAKEPLSNMQKSVEDMKDQLKKLTDSIGTMKESVGAAIHDIDKRTVALETAEAFAPVVKRRRSKQR